MIAILPAAARIAAERLKMAVRARMAGSVIG
jgi:hypothetical protein